MQGANAGEIPPPSADGPPPFNKGGKETTAAAVFLTHTRALSLKAMVKWGENEKKRKKTMGRNPILSLPC